MMNPNDPASPQIHNPKATPPKRTANPTTSQAPSVNMAEMPTVSQPQKRQPDHAPQKKPFQWQFLAFEFQFLLQFQLLGFPF